MATVMLSLEASCITGDEITYGTVYWGLQGLTDSHCRISFNDLTFIYSATEIQPKNYSLIALSNAELRQAGACTSRCRPDSLDRLWSGPDLSPTCPDSVLSPTCAC
jgi:hypothetical protein